MLGGDLIREARRRAGLSQAALARRLRTSQPAVARWEARRTSPSLETVLRAVRACGFDLRVRMTPLDRHDVDLALRRLRLSPARRMVEFLRAVQFADEVRAAGSGNRRRAGR